MNTLETAIVWPVIFMVMTVGMIFGIKTAELSFRQIGRYEAENESTSPAEIRRLVEVVYETLDEI